VILSTVLFVTVLAQQSLEPVDDVRILVSRLDLGSTRRRSEA